jgi:hypothetical protein
LSDPKNFNLDFDSIDKIFVKSENIIAKHVAYDLYLQRIGKPKTAVPKVIFYIIMDSLFRYSINPKTLDYGYCITLFNFHDKTKS